MVADATTVTSTTTVTTPPTTTTVKSGSTTTTIKSTTTTTPKAELEVDHSGRRQGSRLRPLTYETPKQMLPSSVYR